jgi:hypothetical protein
VFHGLRAGRKGQAEIRPADREFVRLLLAEQDRAGVAPAAPGFRILVRDMIQVSPRAAVVRMPRVL